MARHPTIHNSQPERKVAVRKRLIELLDEPLAVLETHCGAGVMRSHCYGDAVRWLGIDKDVAAPHAIHAPSEKVLRAIDLDGFNFFDVDPFASPWLHVWLISQRRAPEGRIALAMTSGVQGNATGMRSSLRKAGWSQQMAEALRVEGDALPRNFIGKKGASRTAKTYVDRWFVGWTLSKWVEARSANGYTWYFGALLQASA